MTVGVVLEGVGTTSDSGIYYITKEHETIYTVLVNIDRLSMSLMIEPPEKKKNSPSYPLFTFVKVVRLTWGVSESLLFPKGDFGSNWSVC